jgi:glyoxylase-like metal-dependent hydrolase (beta-lactamase superfamily II)/Flp pilus assembly protein TadD
MAAENGMNKKMRTVGMLFLLAGMVVFCAPLSASERDSNASADKDVNAHFQKGEKLFLAGDLFAAEREFWQALNGRGVKSRCYYYLAQISYKRDDYDSALSQIEKAEACFGLNAEDREARIKSTITLLRDVIGVLQSEIPLLPVNCSGIRVGESEIDQLIQAKQSQISDLEYMLARGTVAPEKIPAEYEFVHGNILFKLREYPRAREHYANAVQVDPYHKEAHNNLIYACCLSKDFQQAKRAVDMANSLKIALNPALVEYVDRNRDRSYGYDIQGVEWFSVPLSDEARTLYENTYIVFLPAAKQAILIDPGRADKRIDDFIQQNGLKVVKILNTHGHDDHIGANRHYASRFKVEIAACVDDKGLYAGKQRKNMPTEFFSSPTTLQAGDFKVTVIRTPGHTPGSVCYLINNHLFSGDTLFREGVGKVEGRSDGERKAAEAQLREVIRQELFGLPGQTTVFPGHGEITSIQHEIDKSSR